MSENQSPEEHPSPSPHSRRPAWITGAVLILVGLVFLLQNVTGFSLRNWWALFILIPAIGSLTTAVSMYRRNEGKFTAASRGPLIGGLLLLTLTVVFLFGLDWGRVWPVFLIIAGAAAVLSSLGR
jgi:hypothetical protein